MMNRMWPVLSAIAGLAVAAFVLWSRAGRTDRARWWAHRGDGSTLDERMVLFILPGIALVLVALGPLIEYSEFDRSGQWRLAFAPVVMLGLAVAMWGGMQLYVPRWYLPAWLRTRRPRRSGKPR